jgi:hypothetical protein
MIRARPRDGRANDLLMFAGHQRGCFAGGLADHHGRHARCDLALAKHREGFQIDLALIVEGSRQVGYVAGQPGGGCQGGHRGSGRGYHLAEAFPVS